MERAAVLKPSCDSRPNRAVQPATCAGSSLADTGQVRRSDVKGRGGAPAEWLRPALTVGASGEMAEREADLAADRVLGAAEPVPMPNGPAVTNSRHAVQRKAGWAGSVAPLLPGGDLRLQGGEGLTSRDRAFFEPRFGHDFSTVRVHADDRAARSADRMDARAYAVGRDIVFASGEYRPGSAAGRHLLAHELAHVVQQSTSGTPEVRTKLKVNAGLTLDTKGFSTSRSGDVYTAPATTKTSIWNEVFTALLSTPRIFKLKGATNAEINANLDKHMTARHGIVAFASKKKYTFGAGAAFKMNPTYWIVDSAGWRLKPGADRTKAVDDLNVNPREYSIACLAATQLTVEGGGKSPTVEDSGVASSDWIPGDWGYITNTKFPASGGTVGLEGENIIYTGKDRFWGHFGPGIEYKTLTEWFDQVKGWNGGARIEDSRTRPDTGLE
jgi:hypothetical protein